ncbi:MAG: calcium-binding protein [Rhizobiaceae bacterium]
MTTLTLRGNQIGEALQFQTQGTSTTAEIGKVWFLPTDIVTIGFAPSAIGPNGTIIGGSNAITSLSVMTASGQVTTFFTSPNGLDVDPDQERNGADFMYVSEQPAAGVGGAYAGLQLEKIVLSDVPLVAGTNATFSNIGSYVSPTGPVAVPPVLVGDAGDNTLTGTAGADRMDGRQGNDTILSYDGNDVILGGDGNDRVSAGNGNDVIRGGNGNDLIFGGTGSDWLLGEAGNDVLHGTSGTDTMYGGAGGDTFVFGGGDRVMDFSAAAGDQIAFTSVPGLDLSDIRVTVGATATTITYAGETMTLQGVTQPFDIGNAFDLTYVPNFDFL